jgi:hypothetical protein
MRDMVVDPFPWLLMAFSTSTKNTASWAAWQPLSPKVLPKERRPPTAKGRGTAATVASLRQCRANAVLRRAQAGRHAHQADAM